MHVYVDNISLINFNWALINTSSIINKFAAIFNSGPSASKKLFLKAVRQHVCLIYYLGTICLYLIYVILILICTYHILVN